jgi:uncharacterized membrane protein YccC
MSDPNTIEMATRRLTQALDALDAAAERRREADRAQEQLLTQLQSLGADRSRLASELDAALAQTRRLEIAGEDIARRLDAAIEAVRSVIEDDA